ncbi:CTU2 [Candida pseudojiufengensis]|uniref:CTU2 n=1 Tax=Candida pseudojiufengensis TaxID=497109 RepID=UPI0022242424|nr:CTU2 [Candida pseudojiufengensis]KAI5963607.1 CTU2 [Candida pseudojiufengensis]
MKAVVYINSDEVCQKCKNEQAILKARNELHCRECFLRLVRGKQRKQMSDERYKVNYKRNKNEKVLLAYSGGISSLVLLDIIANLLAEQSEAHKGLKGFDLVVINLNEYQYKSLSAKLDSILPQLWKRYSIPMNFKIISINDYLDENTLYAISLDNEFKSFAKQIKTKTTIIDLLNKCPNKSSAEDLLSIILHKLLLKAANKENCNTIIYAHSMTRIANEILALTVKGRGSMIHKSISDRTENIDGKPITIIYPLRDVLHDEIIEYSKLSHLQEYIVDSTILKSKISKNLTIKDLVANYFTNLNETGYASTASTVMKIGQKLTSPQSNTETTTVCKICGVEIFQDPQTWLRSITVNDPAPITTEEEQEYYKMYKSSSAHDISQNGSNIDLCYGCITTLNGTNEFIWPINPSIKISYENSHQNVLDEFVLTDTEE